MSDIIFRGVNEYVTEEQISAGSVAISGLTAATSAHMLHTIRTELALRGSYELGFVTNMGANIVSIMGTLWTYYFGNEHRIKPSAVIGGFALGTVTEKSHAISDRVLKYRSRGGIFLAHQEGGDQTLRIVGKAWGPNRYLFLTILDFLFLYGQATTHDMFARNLKNNLKTLKFSTQAETVPQAEIRVTPWTKIDEGDIEDGVEEKHLTFPVVTTDRVYNNMFIETYDYRESVDLGMNVIEYTLFFRKYLPTTRFIFGVLNQEIPGTTEFEEIWYYTEDEEDVVTRKLRKIDLMTDFGFSLAMLFYRTFVLTNTNSVELNTAMTFGINLNKQTVGDYNEERLIMGQYDSISSEDDLVNLSTSNKEELFALG